jgi:hypothetical protein
MIINPYVYAGGFDPDAQAFITAAGITDNTQKTAINTLVVDMKGYGIWTKMKAIYPMVGGTASTHKWNLKDPRDLDAAFRLVFFGGMTHSSNGILFAGVNGYCDTKLNMSTNYAVNNSTHISFYSRTSAALGASFEMGVFDGVSIIGVTLRRSDFGFGTYYAVNSGAYISFTDSNAAAFYISNRLGTAENGWRNSTKTATATNTALTRPSLNMIIGGQNAGFLNQATTRQVAFSSIGDGLTDTEAGNFYTAVQAFNTTLARQV